MKEIGLSWLDLNCQQVRSVRQVQPHQPLKSASNSAAPSALEEALQSSLLQPSESDAPPQPSSIRPKFLLPESTANIFNADRETLRQTERQSPHSRQSESQLDKSLESLAGHDLSASAAVGGAKTLVSSPSTIAHDKKQQTHNKNQQTRSWPATAIATNCKPKRSSLHIQDHQNQPSVEAEVSRLMTTRIGVGKVLGKASVSVSPMRPRVMMKGTEDQAALRNLQMPALLSNSQHPIVLSRTDLGHVQHHSSQGNEANVLAEKLGANPVGRLAASPSIVNQSQSHVHDAQRDCQDLHASGSSPQKPAAALQNPTAPTRTEENLADNAPVERIASLEDDFQMAMEMQRGRHKRARQKPATFHCGEHLILILAYFSLSAVVLWSHFRSMAHDIRLQIRCSNTGSLLFVRSLRKVYRLWWSS